MFSADLKLMICSWIILDGVIQVIHLHYFVSLILALLIFNYAIIYAVNAMLNNIYIHKVLLHMVPFEQFVKKMTIDKLS